MQEKNGVDLIHLTNIYNNMAKQIYRVKNERWVDDIYDASSGIRIPNAETLRANYSWAQEVSAPVQRDWAWFWVGNKPTGSSPTSQLDSWKGYQKLKEAATKILEMQNKNNKDLTWASSYWNEIRKNTSSFWAPQAPEATTTGQFTDKDFRLMSPADQASVRLSRESAAEWHLAWIEQERKYRENVWGTAMSNVKDIYDIEQRAKNNQLDYDLDKWYKEQTLGSRKSGEEITAIKYKISQWLPVTDEEYKTLWVNSTEWRAWGTISWRNNNPWNLRFKSWQEEYWAKKDTDSSFAVFPSIEKAREAYKALLTSTNSWAVYKGLDNNSAMLKWSSDYEWDPRSYSYDDLVKLWAPAVSKAFANFTNEEWNQFFEAQQQAEWWNEWTLIWRWNNKTSIQLSNAAAILWPSISASDLKNWTTDEIDSAVNAKKDDIYLSAANSSNGEKIQRIYWITPDYISTVLKWLSDWTLTDEDIIADLNSQGKNIKVLEDIKSLNRLSNNTSSIWAWKIWDNQ